MITANTNIEEIKAEIQKRVAILAQTLQGADRDKLEMETRNALNLASEGELGEFDAELLTWVMASDTEWDDIIALLKLLNDLVKDSHPETPNPEKPKGFGFSTIADTVKAEIAESEAKRDADRRFVRSIVKDVAGSYGITSYTYYGVNISGGLTDEEFAKCTRIIREDIRRIVSPRIYDSKSLRDHVEMISKACKASNDSNGTHVGSYTHSIWNEYLEALCPEAIKRLDESECQFKVEAKRSLTVIALILELDALKAAFPTEVASDDDEWI